jgi:Carboxypeptidase regulatory-like domain
MRVRPWYLVLLFLIVAGTNLAATPDICVSETLKVTALRGSVVYQTDQPGAMPVRKALVELRDGLRGSVIAKVVTDNNGYFDFANIPDGDYWIYAEAPQHSSFFAFRVQLKSGDLKRREPLIKVILGFEMDACRGSFARYGATRT